MKEEQLRMIEERCKKAAPGPWLSFIEDRDHTSGSNFIRVADENADDIELIGASNDDQDFIAHARKDILDLVCELRRLKTLLRQNNISY